jgi:hypothetical protein
MSQSRCAFAPSQTTFRSIQRTIEGVRRKKIVKDGKNILTWKLKEHKNSFTTVDETSRAKKQFHSTCRAHYPKCLPVHFPRRCYALSSSGPRTRSRNLQPSPPAGPADFRNHRGSRSTGWRSRLPSTGSGKSPSRRAKSSSTTRDFLSMRTSALPTTMRSSHPCSARWAMVLPSSPVIAGRAA